MHAGDDIKGFKTKAYSRYDLSKCSATELNDSVSSAVIPSPGVDGGDGSGTSSLLSMLSMGGVELSGDRKSVV